MPIRIPSIKPNQAPAFPSASDSRLAQIASVKSIVPYAGVGVLTFNNNPSDGDQLDILYTNTLHLVLTFKTSPSNPNTDIQIGSTILETAENLINLINTKHSDKLKAYFISTSPNVVVAIENINAGVNKNAVLTITVGSYGTVNNSNAYGHNGAKVLNGTSFEIEFYNGSSSQSITINFSGFTNSHGIGNVVSSINSQLSSTPLTSTSTGASRIVLTYNSSTYKSSLYYILVKNDSSGLWEVGQYDEGIADSDLNKIMPNPNGFARLINKFDLVNWKYTNRPLADITENDLEIYKRFKILKEGVDPFTGDPISNTDPLRTFNNLVVEGNIYVTGDVVFTKAGKMLTQSVGTLNVIDNIIVLNQGETGSGVSEGFAGIEIDRGTANNKQFLWREVTVNTVQGWHLDDDTFIKRTTNEALKLTHTTTQAKIGFYGYGGSLTKKLEAVLEQDKFSLVSNNDTTFTILNYNNGDPFLMLRSDKTEPKFTVQMIGSPNQGLVTLERFFSGSKNLFYIKVHSYGTNTSEFQVNSDRILLTLSNLTNLAEFNNNEIRVYRKLSWDKSVLVFDQGGSIELGDPTSTNATPYIDFHAGDVNYSIRLLVKKEGSLNNLGIFDSTQALYIYPKVTGTEFGGGSVIFVKDGSSIKPIFLGVGGTKAFKFSYDSSLNEHSLGFKTDSSGNLSVELINTVTSTPDLNQIKIKLKKLTTNTDTKFIAETNELELVSNNNTTFTILNYNNGDPFLMLRSDKTEPGFIMQWLNPTQDFVVLQRFLQGSSNVFQISVKNYSSVTSEFRIFSDKLSINTGGTPSSALAEFNNNEVRVYRKLSWDKSALIFDQGGSIYLGDTSNTNAVPYIDFFRKTIGTTSDIYPDWQARIGIDYQRIPSPLGEIDAFNILRLTAREHPAIVKGIIELVASYFKFSSPYSGHPNGYVKVVTVNGINDLNGKQVLYISNSP
jgi:hypothetical protein